MMIFNYLETGPLMVNCYIIGEEKTKEAVVIDPGGDVDQILLALSDDKLKCKLIINTHCHFDHIGGNKALKQATKAPLAIHPLEKDILLAMGKMAGHFGMEVEISPPPDQFLQEGDIISLGNKIQLAVLHTPGHSPGHICLNILGQKMAIVGDLLFRFGIGRTDFPGGSHQQLIKSIKEKLYPLGDDCQIYPGHGPPTIIGQEKKHNPFLQEEADWV